MTVYFDTSALVKRYVAEEGSDAVDVFVAGTAGPIWLTPLVSLELESMLQRRLRQRELAAGYCRQVRDGYGNDLRAGVWHVRPLPQVSFARAVELVRDPRCPVSTLDALHLASALELGCTDFVTADHQLARAATACGLTVHSFASFIKEVSLTRKDVLIELQPILAPN